MRYSLLASSLLVLAAALGASASVGADGPRVIRRIRHLAGPSKTTNLTNAQLHSVELTRRRPTRRCEYTQWSDSWHLNNARLGISSDSAPPPAVCAGSGNRHASARGRQLDVHEWEHWRCAWKARSLE